MFFVKTNRYNEYEVFRKTAERYLRGRGSSMRKVDAADSGKWQDVSVHHSFNEHDIDDIFHNSVLVWIEKYPELEARLGKGKNQYGRDNRRAFFTGIVKHQAKMHFVRKEKSLPMEGEKLSRLPRSILPTDAAIEAAENRETWKTTFKSLYPLIKLKLEGYTDEEAAKRLGITRMSIHRKKKLAQQKYLKHLQEV